MQTLNSRVDGVRRRGDATSLALGIKIAKKPDIVWSLVPKALIITQQQQGDINNSPKAPKYLYTVERRVSMLGIRNDYYGLGKYSP